MARQTRREFLKSIGLAATSAAALSVLPGCSGRGRTTDAKWERPNVVLVMTDDQGYGELACHGNTIIKTPNLDKLHEQSTRFTAFHVSPTCAP
ncbi:MAG: sulfatase-like hydrolase/transferase, partial [Planctomycetota bacterium]